MNMGNDTDKNARKKLEKWLAHRYTDTEYDAEPNAPFDNDDYKIAKQSLKTGKSPGDDKVTNEMVQRGGDIL